MTLGSAIGSACAEAVAPLADVLTYRNDLVVRRFMKRFDISQRDADIVFVELLRWLWYLAATKPSLDNPEAHAIDEPLYIIDEMWHEFIIVTQDYTKFCSNICGRYIHHIPDSGQAAQSNHRELDEVKASLAQRIGIKRTKYNEIYDVLGKEVFILWYSDFPQRYSVDAISRMRKQTGRVDTPRQVAIDTTPVDADQDKSDLIEEALFMNLILALPDNADSLGANEEGDAEAREQEGARQAIAPSS